MVYRIYDVPTSFPGSELNDGARTIIELDNPPANWTSVTYWCHWAVKLLR